MSLSYVKSKSYYESIHIEWAGIGYDKEKLVKLIKRIKLLKFLSIFIRSYKHELEILVKIIDSYDKSKLELLLNNDPDYVRMATLEKYARKATNEILAENKFSIETVQSVTNLPTKDYKLFHKRVNELVNLYRSVYIQEDKI